MSRKFGGQSDQYLTPAAIEGLKKELARLKEERPRVVEEVSRTAAMGDLSENAAYQEAKTRLRHIDSRIFSIQERLKQAIPIEKGASDGRVRLGATVVVEVNGQQKTFEIVGSQEADPSHGRISRLSPLGSLLLDQVAGDQVTLKTPNKEIAYRILEVR